MGAGPVQIELSALPNPGNSRAAQISLAGILVTITEAGEAQIRRVRWIMVGFVARNVSLGRNRDHLRLDFHSTLKVESRNRHYWFQPARVTGIVETGLTRT